MMTMDTRALNHIFTRTDKFHKMSAARKLVINLVGEGMCTVVTHL